MTKAAAGAGTVERSGRIRLFCALQLADDAVSCLAAWQAATFERGRIVPPANLHVTLAFLGHRPVGDVEPVGEALRAASAAAGPIELRVRGYRETQSVGMVELDDVRGTAAALAQDVQQRLEALGVYRRERRAWLPHVTVYAFKSVQDWFPTRRTCVRFMSSGALSTVPFSERVEPATQSLRHSKLQQEP